MDIGLLQHFISAAKHLHFGQAAVEMGVAQSALSQRIKALEQRLGVSLFHRVNRGVQLTPAGKVFLREAQLLIETNKRAVRVTRAAEKGNFGELRIGCDSSAVFAANIYKLLQQHVERYPELLLNTHEYSVRDQLEGVAKGRLDVAIVWGPTGREYPALKTQPLLRQSLAVVLQRDHPLADREYLSLEELHDQPFIRLMDPPGMGIGHVIDRMLVQRRIAPRTVVQVNNLLSVFGLAGAGYGLGLVPNLPLDIQSPHCVQRPLAGVGECIELQIVYHGESASTLALNFVASALTLCPAPAA